MSNSVPSLDLSQITFPTDHITVRDIRQEWYQASDTERRLGLLMGLKDLVDTERELAELAFYSALGVEPPAHVYRGMGGIDGAREVLESEYQRRKIAGEHAAKQLVKNIETQASAQAAQFISRKPG
jgi:hypothetical protein